MLFRVLIIPFVFFLVLLCLRFVNAIDREGWLQKRGDVNKSWQRRYFVLKGNLLFYFEKKGDREPIGVIILEGCTVG